MSVPITVADLDATAANNSPLGSEAIGTSLDDYLRAYASIIKQVSNSSTQSADLSSITAGKGAALIGFVQSGTGATARTTQDKLREILHQNDYDSEANYKSARPNRVSIDSTNRIFGPYVVAGTKSFGASGDDWPSSGSLRDAFTVSRDLIGLTDCHGFADKTVIDQVTDYGGYGTFDATTRVKGSHVQDHVFSFQDRTDYQGSGTLQNQAGLYSAPVLSGSGTINNRFGVEILDISNTGTGTVSSQIGVYISDLDAAANNVAINSAQSVGHMLYAAGGAKSYHKGSFGVGIDPASGVKLHVDGGAGAGDVAINVLKTGGWSFFHNDTGKLYNKGDAGFGLQQNSDSFALTVAGASTGPRAFIHTSASVAYFGQVGGDYPIQWIANGVVRLELTGSANSYTFRPGADNTQYLGDVSHRWSAVYAGTGTIQTSDEREKQQIESIDARALRAWAKVNYCQFKFNDAVAEKGDGARWHFGLIAQRVKEAFESEGLDPFEFGILCYDEWEDDYRQVLDEEGEPTGDRELISKAGNRYGIRYEEALALECAYLRSKLQ